MGKFKSKRLILVTGFILVFLILIFHTRVANAEAVSISWSSNKPVVFSSTPLIGLDRTFCNTTFQYKDIAGEFGEKKVCISGNDKVRFGATREGGQGFRSLVSFGYDEKMYKLNAGCTFSDSCLYLAATDTLVTKQYQSNGKLLVVYKNFTKRLSKWFRGVAMEYDLDRSNPDYVFKNENGEPWTIGGYNGSSDGKWVAVEFREKGIGLLNLETLVMKRVSTWAFTYGMGFDPTMEFAVSNGGRQISVMGLRTGMKVFDVTNNCGDIATNDNMKNVSKITTPCPEAVINADEYIRDFTYGIRPRFNDDGGELNFFAFSYWGEIREVSLRASGYGGPRMDYVALGDSFSSGEGETDDKFYQMGTNDQFEKCHLSTRSYPFLVAKLSGIDSAYMRSVACSGAEVKDVIRERGVYWGQGGRLNDIFSEANTTDKMLAQTDARLSFIPGRIHQADFMNVYRPGIATISIGGNDVGFMKKLRTCIGSDICTYATSPREKEQTALEIKKLFPKLVNTYQALHDASPNTRIVVVGYPKVVNETDSCGLVLDKLLDSDEKKFMNEGVRYLNQVIEAAAKKAGVGYIDIENSFGEHVLCGKDPIAMNGIRTGDDSPDGAVKVLGNESFHPNSLGHEYITSSITGSIGHINSYSYCKLNATICPVESVEAPEPSTYWIPDGSAGYPDQRVDEFVEDRDDSTDGRQKQFIVGDQSFESNSVITAEVTSEPHSLGQFIASNVGGLNASVDLPEDLEEGYHTVHLYGSSPSGESIELYDVIAYFKPVEPEEIPTEQEPTSQPETNNEEVTIDLISKKVIENQKDSNNNNDKDEVVITSALIPDEAMVKGVSTTTRKPLTSVSTSKLASKSSSFIPDWLLIGVIGLVSVLLLSTTIFKGKKGSKN